MEGHKRWAVSSCCRRWRQGPKPDCVSAGAEVASNSGLCWAAGRVSSVPRLVPKPCTDTVQVFDWIDWHLESAEWMLPGLSEFSYLYRFQGKPLQASLQAILRRNSCPVYPVVSRISRRFCGVHSLGRLVHDRSTEASIGAHAGSRWGSAARIWARVYRCQYHCEQRQLPAVS